MKKQLQVLLSAGGAMMLSCSAHATLTGLSVFSEPVAGPAPPPTGGPRTIYRVYADFTNSTDRVNAWGIGSDFGDGSIENVLVDGVTPGAGFTNIGGAGGQIAPYYGPGYRDWDCYMTIGVLYGTEAPGGADGTAQIPNTPIFATGPTWTPDLVNGGGVFITPDMEQGSASYRVTGNDTDHRVLLMQLVVNQGQHVAGTIGVAWQAQGEYGVTAPGLTFSSVPLPGGLALLGCAALIGAPRRRDEATAP